MKKIMREEADVKKIIKDLSNSYGDSNEEQGKMVSLLKGLAFSDDPEANKFMKALDKWTTEYSKGVKENSSRLTRNMKEESVDAGLVFYMVAEDFGVHLEKLDPRRERVDFLFEIDERDVLTFEKFFDDILKEFYKKVDSRWKLSWDQDNDLLVKIFR